MKVLLCQLSYSAEHTVMVGIEPTILSRPAKWGYQVLNVESIGRFHSLYGIL